LKTEKTHFKFLVIKSFPDSTKFAIVGFSGDKKMSPCNRL
jgi:hypothetical protein